MDVSLLKLYESGVISAQEALTHALAPAFMERRLKEGGWTAGASA
jgi:Tfp pilus assembly ATPase PilU